jgi:hypothetical protein
MGIQWQMGRIEGTPSHEKGGDLPAEGPRNRSWHSPKESMMHQQEICATVDGSPDDALPRIHCIGDPRDLYGRCFNL